MTDKVLFQFRESWLLFVFAGVILALFSFSPRWHITLPLGVFLAYLCIRPFRHVKVYEDRFEIGRPFAFQKFKVDFASVTRIRHQPSALGNPPAIIFYYKGGAKEKKLAFPQLRGTPIEKILLENRPAIKIIEGFDD